MSSKLRVGLICGGCSQEHEVSLKSAIFIEQYINKDLFEILIIWISKVGNWYIIEKTDFVFLTQDHQKTSIPISFKRNWNTFKFDFNKFLKLDVIFPIIHGTLGEDGSIQGFLNIMKLPYVGSDVLGSAICINKDITKNILSSIGLAVVPFQTFMSYAKSNIDFNNLVNIFGLPLFIKPINQGSSIGVSKVNNLNDFYKALDIAFSYSSKIIIEPCIIGRELECAVLGNNNPIASLCGEIVLKKNTFYSYNDKYIQNTSKIVVPAVIDQVNSNTIRNIAIQAFQILHCFGMARVDVFLTKNNQILINEVNTVPGFTSTSMYPKLWNVTGLNFEKLLTTLLELALERHT